MLKRKDKWSKHKIKVILVNKKYKGSVRLFVSENFDVQYLSTKNYAPIISDEKFEAIQQTKKERSIIKIDKHRNKVRKAIKYSSMK